MRVALFGIVAIFICMKNWREKASELCHWELKGVLIFYPIVFIILLIPIIFWNVKNIYCFNTFTIADDSARYLLSALVQSLAAIIAIVVTLTLVAVQLSASAYSPRVIDIFKKDWVMWLLLVWYGLSIFFGLFVLEMIEGEYQNLSHWGVSLESCVFLVYLMGIVAFAWVFWHIGNVINLLKPENIIKRLAVEITEDKILNPKKDPIQPIMDIIHISIMKYDIATVECGLDAVMKKAADIIGISKYSDDESISMHFCGQLGTAGRCALHAGEDESVMELIGCLEDIGRLAMPSDRTVKIAVQYIEMIGTVAAEKKLRFVTCDAMESLKDVGILAAENRLADTASQSINSLENVGMYAAENKIGIAAQYAAKYLGRVGRCATENELESAAKQAVGALGVIGNYAVENKLKNATEQAAESLGAAGKAAAEKGLEDAASRAAASLGGLGKAAAEKELEDAALRAVLSLEVVGTTAAEKGLDDAVWQAAWSLGAVGKAAAEKGLKRVALRAVLSLEVVGTTAAAAGTGLEHETLRAVLSLGVVGKIIAENGLEDATKQVALSLECVGKLTAENGLGGATFEVTKSLGVILKIVAENGRGDATKQVARSLGVVGIVAYNRMVAAEKDGKQEEWKELDTVTYEVAKHLVKLSMSIEECAEILLGARRDTKQLHIGSESFYGFLDIYNEVSGW